PELVRLATVQHLATQIVGRLADDMSLLEVLGVLHPTPAVGGTPRTEAASFIEKLEAVDRGWYSGGIGWSDTGGDGEVAVALRCALMSGEVSRLYAGAGIVAESDPDAELAETRLKLAPLLSVLAAG
ncbi:MAG: chorismate-binding protein, partial [Acidimicrobiia bacterium]